MTTQKLQYILTKPNYIKFEETVLLLIYTQDNLIGFFHFLIAPKFLKEDFFNIVSKNIEIILVCNFGIEPRYRGKGIATQVYNYILQHWGEENQSITLPNIQFFGAKEYLKILSNINRSSLITIFDTKNLTHFWGNTLYPDEILWGHPEGIGIMENDIATKKFVEKFSHRPLKEAVELKLNIADFKITKSIKKIISLNNTEPLLDEYVSNLKSFKTNYFSKTFLALNSEEKVLGYIILFPLKPLATDNWGIYELNVSQVEAGIGSALLTEAVKFLNTKKCENLYTVTIPTESPNAILFYKKHKFTEIQKWLI